MTTSLVRRSTPLIALLAGDGFSRMGNAVTLVAVPLLALEVSGGSPWAVAAAGVAATLPIILGGAMGGAVVDRIGFRRASIIADAASGLTIAAIPVLTAFRALPLWVLLLLVFVSNLLDAPGNAARQSQIPELCVLADVPLTKATAAQAAVSRSATLLGASLAGLLVALYSAAVAMYLTAGTFAIAIVLTVAFVPRLALPDERDDEAAGGAAGFAAGFRFILRTPLVRAVVLMVLLTNAIDIAGVTVLKPLYAANIGDGAALGLMVACSAGGALVGAAAYGFIGDRVPRHGLFILLFIMAGVLPYLTLAFGPPLPIVLVALALAGLSSGPINPLIDSALFHLIPAAIRARVLGAITAGVAAAMPIGSFLAGLGVTTLGLTGTLFAAAAVYLTVILTTGFGRRWRTF